VLLCVFVALQEKDTIRLRREAKANGGFYVEPEAKLAFVVRIRGLNKIHPKVRRCCCSCCCKSCSLVHAEHLLLLQSSLAQSTALCSVVSTHV
jgi:hypothetical protein